MQLKNKGKSNATQPKMQAKNTKQKVNPTQSRKQRNTNQKRNYSSWKWLSLLY